MTAAMEEEIPMTEVHHQSVATPTGTSMSPTAVEMMQGRGMVCAAAAAADRWRQMREKLPSAPHFPLHPDRHL